MVGLTAPKVKSSEPIDRDSLPVLAECRLVEDAIEEVMGRQWRIGVELVREAMLRYSEFLALRPECIDFVDRNGDSLRRIRLTEAIVEVRHEFYEKDLKNHRIRSTSFHPWLEPHLHELLEASRPGERMFLKPTGRYMDRRTWSRKWRKALDLAGFAGSGWTLHTWRAFGACVWLFDRDADPGAVSEALGHSSVDFTLRRYTAARGSVAKTLTDVGDRSSI
jgi:integrase